MLDLAGTSAQDRLHDVTFDGLGVQYSDFVSWYRNGWVAGGDAGAEHKYPEYDRQIEMPRNRFGAIRLTNTSSIDLSRMHLSDTGFTGDLSCCSPTTTPGSPTACWRTSVPTGSRSRAAGPEKVT